MASSYLSPLATARRSRSPSSLLCLAALLLHISFTAALVPTRIQRDWGRNALEPRAVAGGKPLRVLPIGDSITWGAQSTDSNGYRKTLFDKLYKLGNDLTFVGSEYTGTGTGWDEHHEGHRRYTIDQIKGASSVGIHAGPNVILLHAGTNDMNRNIDVDTAPDRIKSLMDVIHKQNPHAVFLLCQIIPAPNPDTHARINKFNAALADRVKAWKTEMNIILVPMNEALGLSDIKDDLHPNDGGYVKMANAYYDAFMQADSNGWITTPDKATTADNCRSTPAWHKRGSIAAGPSAAHSDGPFVPGFVSKGSLTKGFCAGYSVRFPDLDGDGIADYACVNLQNGSVDGYIRSKSDGTYKSMGRIADGQKSRTGLLVIFADLNGDSVDDYIWEDYDTGDVYAWINDGPDASTGKWQWDPLGVIGNTGVSANNGTLSMADINGDGRADFLVTDLATGAITAWLNTGAERMPVYYKIGDIASGATASKNDVVQMADFTGEGRADYMIIGKTGKVTGFVNRRQEKSLLPRWSQLYTVADGPSGAKQGQVHFADIDGDGKVDYLLVDDKTGATRWWQNTGTGGKYQTGDGVFLCDLDGDGISDYFWIDPTGKGYGYINTGHGTDNWQNIGEIASGDHPRELVRMGRMTTSGRADYIALDATTGAAQWWKNTGSEGKWQFEGQGVLATGPSKTISSRFHWQFRVENVRFADLDGDGLDDYLYVHEQGYVVMWRNLNTNPVSWGVPHMVASPKKHVLSSVVHFADTNGDGMTDYVVIGQETGQARVWLNLGINSDGTINWQTPIPFADGTGPGGAIMLADMTGDERADWVSVDPDNGRLDLWENGCWSDGSSTPPPTGGTGNDGGDDGDPGDDWGQLPLCKEFFFETWHTLQNLANDKSIPDHCRSLYAIAVLQNMVGNLSNTLEYLDYNYDEQFDYYVKYVHKAISSSLEYNFMFNSSKMTDVAKDDHLFPPLEIGMNYFDCKLSPSHEYDDCPYVFKHSTNWAGPTGQSVDFRLRDKDGYESAIQKLGIIDGWHAFGDASLAYQLPGEGCWPCLVEVTDAYRNFPVVNSTMVVPNAKGTAKDAMPKLLQLSYDMETSALYMMAGLWVGGDTRDAVTNFGGPIALMETSLDEMLAAKTLGQKEEDEENELAEQKRRSFILLMVGIGLAVVPIIGEAALEALGFAALGALFDLLIGTIGGLAFDLYTLLTSDGGVSIITIFSTIFGAFGLALKEKRFLGPLMAQAARTPLSDLEGIDGFLSHVTEIEGILADIITFTDCAANT